jgi:hypothetical protein
MMRFPAVLALGKRIDTEPTPEPCTAASCFNAIAVPVLVPTVIASVAEPDPEELVAEIVTLIVPAVVGCPEISPVDVFIDRPAGNGDAP